MSTIGTIHRPVTARRPAPAVSRATAAPAFAPGWTHPGTDGTRAAGHAAAAPGAATVTNNPAGRTSRTRRLVTGVRRGLGNLVLITVVVAFLGLAVGPHLFGYRTMTMLTGSMAPGINPGDVTVVVPEPVRDLAVGQVISYHIPVDDHRVVSHRVVEVVHAADGTTRIRTKGDANAAADPWTATISDPQVWTVRAVVPHLGEVIRVLRGPGLHILFLYVGPAALTLLLMAQIWGRPRTTVPEGSTNVSADDALDVARLEVLRGDLGGTGLRDFLTRWRDLLDARVNRLQDAIATEDPEATQDVVLSLKVTSAMIGLTPLSQAFAAIEDELVNGDPAGAADRLDTARELVPAARAAVDAQLDTLAV